MHSLYFNERGKINYNIKHGIKNLQWIINNIFQLKTVKE